MEQAVIVIPRVLESQLRPGIIAQITIDIIDNLNKLGENEDESS